MLAVTVRHIRLLLLLCGLIAAGYAAVAHVASTVDSRASLVRAKVQQAVLSGLWATANAYDPVAGPSYEATAPRLRLTDTAGHVFYTPAMIGDPAAEYAVMREAAAQLNQDLSVPLLHIDSLRTSTDYKAYFRATATVEFEVYPWLNRTITVHASVPLARLAGPTGYAISTVRAPQSYLPADIARVTVAYMQSDGTVAISELTGRASILRLIRAINAIRRYQPQPTSKPLCPANNDVSEATMQFFGPHGRLLSGTVYSDRCMGMILSDDPSFIAAYPALDGNVWALLTALAPHTR